MFSLKPVREVSGHRASACKAKREIRTGPQWRGAMRPIPPPHLPPGPGPSPATREASMPEIDLGDFVTAWIEKDGGIAIDNSFTDERVNLTRPQFDKLAAFVAKHGSRS